MTIKWVRSICRTRYHSTRQGCVRFTTGIAIFLIIRVLIPRYNGKSHGSSFPLCRKFTAVNRHCFWNIFIPSIKSIAWTLQIICIDIDRSTIGGINRVYTIAAAKIKGDQIISSVIPDLNNRRTVCVDHQIFVVSAGIETLILIGKGFANRSHIKICANSSASIALLDLRSSQFIASAIYRLLIVFHRIVYQCRIIYHNNSHGIRYIGQVQRDCITIKRYARRSILRKNRLIAGDCRNSYSSRCSQQPSTSLCTRSACA